MRNKVSTAYLVLLTTVAAMGGLLFGFDIAIITGAIPFIETYFQLSKIQLGWGASSLLFGCIAGSAIAGRITDIFGRKRILVIVAILFTLTSLATALAPTFTLFVIARLCGGLAVGAASILSPIYLSEVAPPKIRGRLVSLYQLSIVVGILISYLINYSLHDIGENNWRWMFATGVIPSVVFLGLLMVVPETPRFLCKVNKEDEAFKIIEKLSGTEVAQKEIQEIKESMVEVKNNYKEIFKPELRRMMMVGFWLAVFIQVSGINAIIDYAPMIFKTAGFNVDSALFATFGLGIVNTICTFVSVWVIDKFGRKPLYVIGSAGMTIALIILSALKFSGHFEGVFVLIMCIVYLAFFSSCIGPVFWTLVSEIYPNSIRGTAMSVPVFTQWFFNGLMVLVFPWVLENIPILGFGTIALMALAQMLFTIKFVPETKGKTLEEIEHYWLHHK